MGNQLNNLLSPTSPIEENHRILGMEKKESNVDGDIGNESSYKRYEQDTGSLLRWCRSSEHSSHSLLKRKWVDAPEKNPSAKSHPLQFRIMQWNILADALSSGKDNFIKCPREALDWDLRKRHILEEMVTYMPDIICCQEVDHFEDFLQPMLKKVGYEGAFLPKPWSPCLDVEPNNGPDGCAIFYNPAKFQLIDYKAITLKTLTCWRNHVALFHLFKYKGLNSLSERASDKRGDSVYEPGMFLVGTTHLKAKVGYESLRTTQGKDILSFLKSYASAGVPILMCGDFNATPDEEVYKLFCQSEEPELRSAYSCFGDSYMIGDSRIQREPPYTTWCVRPQGETPKTVDYLWYSPHDFRLNGLLQIPPPEALTVNRLPSFAYPSDHVSLVCDLELLCNHDPVLDNCAKY